MGWDVVVTEHEVTTIRGADTLRVENGHAQFYDKRLQLIAAFAPGHWQSVIKTDEVSKKEK